MYRIPSVRFSSAVLPSALAAAAVSALALALAALPARAEPLPPGRLDKPAARTPVLIELFTSEGCSSCPSADATLMQLVREQPLENVQLIALEEHVDYWNNLGWADPFSSPLFTERQEAFLSAVNRDGMYTPQAVIDGRSDAVGSSRRDILSAAKQAAAEPHGEISLEVVHRDAKSLELRAKATGLAKGPAELWVALVEDALSTQVPRGENAGRNLPHAAVVRALVKVSSAADALSGTVSIPLDPSWSSAHLRPIAFAQNPGTRHILASIAP